MRPREFGRIKRHQRIRKKLWGSPERPRMSVHRSLANLSVQLIDDTVAKTIFSFSTLDKDFAEACGKLSKVETARKLGKFFGPQLKQKGISKVAFDRGGCVYHGRVKALAEALREAGVEF